MTTSNAKPACTVAMMLAMDNNKLIGKEGGMPWHIPGEMAYFKAVTMGKPIIMGRKTFDSIGKPLPGRPNFVVTRNTQWQADGVHVCASLDLAIEGAMRYYAEQASTEQGADEKLNPSLTSDDNTALPEVMVIGGAGLCREAMPQTERIYLTLIDNEYEGDIYFDSFEWDDWQERSRKEMQHEALKYSYLVLERP